MGYYKIKHIDYFLCILEEFIMGLLTGMDIDDAFKLGLDKLANELIRRGVSPSTTQSAIDAVLLQAEKEENARLLEEDMLQAPDIKHIRDDIECDDAAFEAFCSMFNINTFTRTVDGFKILTKANVSSQALSKSVVERIIFDNTPGLYTVPMPFPIMRKLNIRALQQLTYVNSGIVYRECIDYSMPEYRNILIDVTETNEIRIKLVNVEWL